MDFSFIVGIFQEFINSTLIKLEVTGPYIIGAIIILIFGAGISYGIYKFIMYIFRKFRILEIIDKVWIGFEEHTSSIVDSKQSETIKVGTNRPSQIRYDRIFAKATSYYVFLLFFRWAVVVVGITEVEKFMSDLIGYLPSLFIGVMIGFFGMRFANSVHDIVYKAMELTKQETSKIIAVGAKMIVMFFTLMIMLNYIKIVDEFIINALFLGFITTLTIGVGLAFGLGGRDIAREILESFRK
ncbi:hypothetical protein LAT59_04055 [Candidatus Gracilibacteria bacterium]|nr:hypothetical protein [Candidatus Gracilibacteria bacterium]